MEILFISRRIGVLTFKCSLDVDRRFGCNFNYCIHFFTRIELGTKQGLHYNNIAVETQN